MRDMLNKLGAAAKRTAKNVANDVSVAAEKQYLSDCYRDLGKLCYQAIKRGETPVFPDEVAKIDEALKHIENLKDRRNVTNVDTAPKPEPTVTVEPVQTEVPTAEEPDFVLVEEE